MNHDWHTLNSTYLSASMRRMRLLLQQFICRKNGTDEPLPADADEAVATMSNAVDDNPLPSLVHIGEQFHLSPFEFDVLLLTIAMEMDTGLATYCAQAQDNPHRPYPTFALALALFDRATWGALAPESPLRYWQFINLDERAPEPLIVRRLHADERIVNYAKGLNTLDPRLAAVLSAIEMPAHDLPDSQQEVVQRIVQDVQHTRSAPTIQLLGSDTISKKHIACQIAAHLGYHLYHLPVGLLPGGVADLEQFVRLWERESVLLPLALYLDAGDLHLVDDSLISPLVRFLIRNKALCFLNVQERWSNAQIDTVLVDVDKPTPMEQRQLWQQLIDTDRSDLPALLAGQFNLNAQAIASIARTTRSPQDLWHAARLHTRPRMEHLAQRLDARAEWDDLILPLPQKRLLEHLVMQVQLRGRVYDDWGYRQRMNRGFGISVLFAGDSGTGKTMAAEVIANELQLDLYRIDLSSVVSKYIGDTEKNLRKLFDAAEDGGVILFFDEADSLFGKRSEVKDSHDRYANIEINYLLQRIESYTGLAILATNMKDVLDDAFMRRLRFIVDFPFPGTAERRHIWQTIFPTNVPGTEQLDYDWLSRLTVTGGSIHNIALNAAFIAARDGSSLTTQMVLDAAHIEFTKLGLPINEALFRWTHTNGVRR
jgi:hypothetical protein